MLILKILSFVFLIPGFLTVFLARMIVNKTGLNKKMKVDFENEMTEEELEKYKFNKALVNVKMLGMLIALPGMVFLFIAFK